MKVYVLFLSCYFYWGSALAQEKLTWYHPNFPPANFVEDLMEGLGHNDQAEKFIAKKLPQYQHQYATASYQRIMHSLKYGRGCSVGIYKSSDREEKLYFSQPYLLTFPNGLIIKEKQRHRFERYLDSNKAISIKKLLSDERLIGGIADGRKYQGAIDLELNNHRNKDNIIVRSNTDVFAGLLQMLDKDRIDYLFGFPEELAYHTSLGVLDNKIQFIPINEMPDFLTSYIVCSKSPWGEKVIVQVNKVLSKYRNQPEFLRFYRFWLDFDSKKRHVKLSQSEVSSAN